MSMNIQSSRTVSVTPVRLAVTGELDMANANQLVREVERAVRRSGPGDVELDLAGVSFIDSSGISALLQSRHCAVSAGRVFRIDNVTPVVRRTLQLAGVTAMLGLGDSAAPPPASMPRPSIPATASAAALPDALAALSQYFISHATMVEALQRVGQITLSALQRANSVAVSMTVDGRLGAHTYSDPQVEDVDRLQYETGNGPSVDTLLNGEVVVIRSTTSDGPYAAFRRAAIGAGVRSVLCLPMHTGTKIIGALTFYSTDEDAFAATDIEVGSTFAKQAAFVLANAQAYWDARTLSENLTQAMQSRAEIEQAKGIIMATAGLSADAAFEQLVKQSQHENVKVRDLATEIVRRSQRSRPQ